MTKAVTAVATLRLVEQGALALDDPVDRWLPELADRQLLREVDGSLADTEPARDPITVRHLLTCTSGYGMGAAESPLGRAMTASGVDAGPHPYGIGADEWLGRLAALPLAHQPGAGWRYHHSFSILGVLLARAVDRPLDEHLRADVLGPIGMPDTGFYVPDAKLDRLPAGYRLTGGALADASGMPTSTVTDIVDRLVKAGFVERVRDGHDRRKVNLVLTARVGEIQERYAASDLTGHVADVAAGFSDPELRIVLRWFRALSEDVTS